MKKIIFLICAFLSNIGFAAIPQLPANFLCQGEEVITVSTKTTDNGVLVYRLVDEYYSVDKSKFIFSQYKDLQVFSSEGFYYGDGIFLKTSASSADLRFDRDTVVAKYGWRIYNENKKVIHKQFKMNFESEYDSTYSYKFKIKAIDSFYYGNRFVRNIESVSVKGSGRCYRIWSI